MPKENKKAQRIDNQLQNKCKKLIDTADKLKIAKQTGFTISYIDMIIAGTRYNENIIKALRKRVAKKLIELTK